MIKLLQYDAKEMKSVFLVFLLYIVLIMTSKLFISNPSIIILLTSFESAFMFLIIFVFNIIFLYSSTFSDRGYLTFKLKLSRKKIVLSKILITFFIHILAFIIVFASMYLLPIDFPNEVYKYFIIPFPILLLIGILSNIVDVYLAMAIGNTSNKNKKMMSFISYLGVYFINQLSGIFLLLFFILKYMKSSPISEFFTPSNMDSIINNSLNSILSAIVVYFIILIIFKILLLFHFVEKKLNF